MYNLFNGFIYGDSLVFLQPRSWSMKLHNAVTFYYIAIAYKEVHCTRADNAACT